MNPAEQAEQLAAKLFYVQQQQEAFKTEEDTIKQALEDLYTYNPIPAKVDIQMLFNDGTFRRVRLQRQKTGTYFKVADDYKDDYSKESHGLQAKYLNSGRAKMAEKAATWNVREVKG